MKPSAITVDVRVIPEMSSFVEVVRAAVAWHIAAEGDVDGSEARLREAVERLNLTDWDEPEGEL